MSRESQIDDFAIDLPSLVLEIKAAEHWSIKCKLIIKFHRMQVEKFPKKRNKGKWKLADTALALGLSIGYVSEMIKIIEFTERSANTVEWREISREMILRIIHDAEK